MGQVVGAAVAPVALSGRVHDGEVPRPAFVAEAPLQGREQGLGNSRPDEAAGGHGLAVLHQAQGLLGAADRGPRRAHPIHPPLTWMTCPVT